MSLKPEPIPPVPPATARIAKAAFPKGSTFIRMRDELGVLYTNETFAPLFPPDGQPALAPWRLALVTIMQFVEGLVSSPGSGRSPRTGGLEIRPQPRTRG